MGNANGREEEEEEENGEPYGDEEPPSVRSRSDVDPDLARVRCARSAGSVGASPPESPGRSLSPLMFAPQMPVPPLQGTPEVKPVFNQLCLNEPDEPMDGPPEKRIPTLITWNRGGESVLLEGSWDNWKSRTSLQDSGKDHAILLPLPSGAYHYRFIVDGQPRYIPDLPVVADDNGNISNLLDVTDYVPENLDGISEFNLPPSPDSSYSWSLPSDEDFSKEPPAIPSQLHLTVLDMHKAEEPLPKPQHVVLNHLFIEKGSSSQSMVALGLTHRFRSKYVSVVLYKPVRR